MPNLPRDEDLHPYDRCGCDFCRTRRLWFPNEPLYLAAWDAVLSTKNMARCRAWELLLADRATNEPVWREPPCKGWACRWCAESRWLGEYRRANRVLPDRVSVVLLDRSDRKGISAVQRRRHRRESETELIVTRTDSLIEISDVDLGGRTAPSAEWTERPESLAFIGVNAFKLPGVVKIQWRGEWMEKSDPRFKRIGDVTGIRRRTLFLAKVVAKERGLSYTGTHPEPKYMSIDQWAGILIEAKNRASTERDERAAK